MSILDSLSREREGHEVAIARWRSGQTRDIRDPGAGQQRNIKLGRFAGLSIEPQMGSDFLHKGFVASQKKA